jgi:hypothetical protein
MVHRASWEKPFLTKFHVDARPQRKWVLVGKLGVSLGFKWKYRPFESKVIAPEWFIEAISSPFM